MIERFKKDERVAEEAAHMPEVKLPMALVLADFTSE